MIICGIDPGTRFTGYGVLEIKGNQVSYLDHGTISPKGDDLPDRLKMVQLGIAEGLERFSPEEVAVETSFYAKNAQTALKLGQVRGVIVLAASLLDIPVFEYTPTEVKKATCGFGRADKDQRSVNRLHRLDAVVRHIVVILRREPGVELIEEICELGQPRGRNLGGRLQLRRQLDLEVRVGLGAGLLDELCRQRFRAAADRGRLGLTTFTDDPVASFADER